LSGSPPPSSGTPATDRPSLGGGVADMARALDLELLPWQREVADRALEVVGDRLAFRSVTLSVPRQNGKSVLLWTLMTYRLLSAPGQTVTYTCQSRLAGRERMIDRWWPRVRRSPLGDMFSVSKATGGEALKCSNGSVLLLLSGDEASGHGASIDLAVLDEGWSLDGTAEASVRPAMAARANAQMWAASCAGTERSVWWRQQIEAGRAAADAGLTDGVCFLEWAAPLGADIGDPATWRSCMPALGRLIDERTIQADLAAMTPATFTRSYCNWWPDESDDGWAVIPKDVWEASRL
jgi:phage terminase large subunit-like protein